MNKRYLRNTFYLDFNDPKIQKLIEPFRELNTTQEKIASLYLKVRDSWRYSPFVIGLTEEHYVASVIYDKKEAHCIDKAILLVTGLRGLGIPSRLHLAKVSNHIAAERLEEQLGTNELAPHGLVDVYFNGHWRKCSPAFNKELCDKYNVDVLDFDGTEDSVLQEYNRNHTKFMEYLEDYGYFEDVPLDYIKSIFQNHYPEFYDTYKDKKEVNFNSI